MSISYPVEQLLGEIERRPDGISVSPSRVGALVRVVKSPMFRGVLLRTLSALTLSYVLVSLLKGLMS